MLKTSLFASAAASLFLVTAAVAVPLNFATHRASAIDRAGFAAGQGSLNRAISTVEELTGGRVLEIRFDGSESLKHYDALVARNGKVDHALVNLTTKQVAFVDPSQDSGRTFDYKAKANDEVVVRASRVALRDAVANAEQSSRGVAVSARTTRSGDGYMVAHDIETVRGDMVHATLVDAKTGLVIGDAQAFAGEP